MVELDFSIGGIDNGYGLRLAPATFFGSLKFFIISSISFADLALSLYSPLTATNQPSFSWVILKPEVYSVLSHDSFLLMSYRSLLQLCKLGSDFINSF